MSEDNKKKNPNIDDSKLQQFYEEASKSQDFDKEDLEKVKKVQAAYLAIQADMGQLAVARLRLNQQLESLDEADDLVYNKWKENQLEENETIMSITDKYGIGTLDPDTGKFVPSDAQIQMNIDKKIKEYEKNKGPLPEPKKPATNTKSSGTPISDVLDKAVEDGKINQK